MYIILAICVYLDASILKVKKCERNSLWRADKFWVEPMDLKLL